MIGGLYAITRPGPALLKDVTSALAGGIRVLQYRDKGRDRERRLHEVQALLVLCRQHRVPLLVNDDVELAAAAGADGVHLGQGDASLASARERLGASAIIGVTCHDRLDLAEAAAQGGANYLAFGAMFASPTKPATIACPLATLKRARALFSLPLVAIGGITPDNAGQVIQAGADAVAVISALWEAPDIAQRARQFSKECMRT